MTSIPSQSGPIQAIPTGTAGAGAMNTIPAGVSAPQTIPAGASAPNTIPAGGPARSEPPPQEKHPLAGPVSDWLQLLSRALRATRFYPAASATRVQQVEAVVKASGPLLEKEPHLVLRVREDRLLLVKDPVLIDSDRTNGLPYNLYSNSIFELSFSQGLTPRELTQFLETLVTDFGSEQHQGEDLLSLLWRLDLEHIQYQHVDILAAAFRGSEDSLGAVEDAEVRRLRDELEGLVSTLAFNRQDGSDFRVMFDRGLETPAGARAAEDWEETALSTLVVKLEAKHPRSELSLLERDIDDLNKTEALSNRMLHALLGSLQHMRDAEATTRVLEVLSRLVEGALKGRDFRSSMALVESLHGILGRDGDATMLSLVERLLQQLGGEEQITTAIEALNQAETKAEQGRIIDYLRMLGPGAVEAVASLIGTVEAPEVRSSLGQILLDNGARRPDVLVRHLQQVPGDVAVSLLETSDKLPPQARSAAIWMGAEHDDPNVRSAALALLEGYGPGHADALIVEALTDSDEQVRIKALELVVDREIELAHRQLSRMVRMREQEQRGPDELRQILRAYAVAGGSKVVSDLVRVMSHTGGLLDLAKSTTAQADAAAALGLIDHEAARDALRKGARSLNPILRKACKEALTPTSKFGMSGPVRNLPSLGPKVEAGLPSQSSGRSSAPPPAVRPSDPPIATIPKSSGPDEALALMEIGRHEAPIRSSPEIDAPGLTVLPASPKLQRDAMSVPPPDAARGASHSSPSSAPPKGRMSMASPAADPKNRVEVMPGFPSRPSTKPSPPPPPPPAVFELPVDALQPLASEAGEEQTEPEELSVLIDLASEPPPPTQAEQDSVVDELARFIQEELEDS